MVVVWGSLQQHETSIIATTERAETRMIVNRRNFMAAIQPQSAGRGHYFVGLRGNRFTITPRCHLFALIATQNPYIGVEKFCTKLILLGHEDENDDDDHGCGVAVWEW